MESDDQQGQRQDVPEAMETSTTEGDDDGGGVVGGEGDTVSSSLPNADEEKDSAPAHPTGGSGNREDITDEALLRSPDKQAGGGESSKEFSSGAAVDKSWKPEVVPCCGIPKCGRRTDQLVFATSAVLMYYGFRNRLMLLKVCPGCVAKAEEFQKKSVEALKDMRCLFTLKHEPQHIPGGDDAGSSSSDVTSSTNTSKSEEQVEIGYERTDIEKLVKSVLTKFKMKRQMQACRETVVGEALELQSEFNDLEEMFDSTDDILHNAYKRYNQIYDTRSQPYVIEEVEINANGSVRKRSTASGNAVFANTDALIKGQTAKSEITGDSKIGLVDDSKKATKKILRPTPSVIPRVKPKTGDIVYVLNKSLLNPWLQAEILEIVDNPDTKQTEFIVQFEPTKNGKPTGGARTDGTIRSIKQHCMKEIAYSVPFPFLLPVGTRVIAKYKDEMTSSKGAGNYYAGIIAEPAKQNSLDRYLILFDDGYCQYVQPDDVLVVCECSKEVWNDVHPDSYKFIKDYIIEYPEWPKVRFPEGAIVSTEWNGKWLVARVLELDCSMAKVRFESDGREEWIFRGSPRFRPIFKVIKQKLESKENKIPRRRSDWVNAPGDPSIVHERTETGKSSQIAVKSTAGGPPHENHRPTNQLPDSDLCIEFQGYVTKVKIPDDALKPKDFIAHDCNSACVIEYVPTREMKSRSPLAIPLFLGWAREIGMYPRQSVFYRTPCGVRVRDYDELSTYLKTTRSNLSLDFFCFDQSINCLNEFKPARTMTLAKDVSYGREAVPVQCLNSIDHDPLPYLEYTPGQIVDSDVNLSTDTGFMVCCDCTDDCSDKEKCACWKLTREGISFTKFSDPSCPLVGYENRRLREHITSGIYECNANCKCKQTCTNRVVQSGVTWPLQIFKTARKGWGIRALYDMPEGSFICIYAGQILTDQRANADGMLNGDEYLAALDFIEITEDIKADYESDVTDIEDEEESEEDNDDEMLPAGKKSRLEESIDQGEVENDETVESADTPVKTKSFAARRTDGQKTNLNHFNMDEDLISARTRAPNYFNPNVKEKKKKRRLRTRSLYSPDEQAYIMDAKRKGNIGRYLNHSCRPNVFVQNVFVNTHDLRFPMVAFFTNTLVKAGTELTWDYHYDIGCVPEKKINCFCMTPYCRGRLL